MKLALFDCDGTLVDSQEVIVSAMTRAFTRAAREGRNPRTGNPVKIEASKAPKFTPGKGLKETVNG